MAHIVSRNQRFYVAAYDGIDPRYWTRTPPQSVVPVDASPSHSVPIAPRGGHGVVGTLWDDEASMKAADVAAEQRRQEAASRGVEFGEMSTRVLLFSHLT